MFSSLCPDTVDAIYFDVGDTLVFDTPNIDERFHTLLSGLGFNRKLEAVTAALREVETYVLPFYVAGDDVDSDSFQRISTEVLFKNLDLSTMNDTQWAGFRSSFYNLPVERFLHPGAIGLIQYLRSLGIKIGVISDWDASLPLLLDELGLIRLLDSVTVSDIVGCRKPGRRIFEHALNQLGIVPSRALHVGDFFELDTRGAVETGMQSVLFDWRFRTDGSLAPTVRTFDELSLALSYRVEHES